MLWSIKFQPGVPVIGLWNIHISYQHSSKESFSEIWFCQSKIFLTSKMLEVHMGGGLKYNTLRNHDQIISEHPTKQKNFTMSQTTQRNPNCTHNMDFIGLFPQNLASKQGFALKSTLKFDRALTELCVLFLENGWLWPLRAGSVQSTKLLFFPSSALPLPWSKHVCLIFLYWG